MEFRIPWPIEFSPGVSRSNSEVDGSGRRSRTCCD